MLTISKKKTAACRRAAAAGWIDLSQGRGGGGKQKPQSQTKIPLFLVEKLVQRHIRAAGRALLGDPESFAHEGDQENVKCRAKIAADPKLAAARHRAMPWGETIAERAGTRALISRCFCPTRSGGCSGAGARAPRSCFIGTLRALVRAGGKRKQASAETGLPEYFAPDSKCFAAAAGRRVVDCASDLPGPWSAFFFFALHGCGFQKDGAST